MKRFKVIAEQTTRLLGAVVYGERFHSLCACFYKRRHRPVEGRLVRIINWLANDKHHCIKAWLKSRSLEYWATKWDS